MNNKKYGFTLVELVAVIVIIGLLFTIAVPSAITLGNKVKNKAYDTKISMIESAGEQYGIDNLESLSNSSKKDIDDGGKYPCITLTVKDLVEYGYMDYDIKNACIEDSSCNPEQEKYNNYVENPNNNYVINDCEVYVYYKSNRAYAKFDTSCTGIEFNEIK